MPGENSLYRKIQIVLDVAVSIEVSSLNNLKEEIKSRRPPNFLTKKYDHKINTFVTDVSERSIRRTTNFCYRLGLVEADGGLTEIGRKALHKKHFEGIVSAQIRSFLKRAGVNLLELNQIIQNHLKADPPVLPTCKEIWVATGNQISYPTFSRLLTLLAQCGGAHSSQRKIYLHIMEELSAVG